jgi:hypothetical protein
VKNTEMFVVLAFFLILLVTPVFAQSTGFTVTSVSTSSVITKDTDPAKTYWIINTQLNGGGQSITGTLDPATVKSYMNNKVYTNKSLSIQVTSDNEQVFYDVINEGVPVYHYNLVTYDAPQDCPLGVCYITDDPQGCPSGTNWNIPLGKSFFGHAKKRYCVTKQAIGVKGVFNNPTITFTAKIKVSAGGTTKEKTICSGASKGCQGTSVDLDDLGVASWSGSLVTGDSPPNQDNFVAVYQYDSQKWQIARRSTYEAYFPTVSTADSALNSFVNLFPGYTDVVSGDREINNAISPVNQAVETLVSEDTSFTSSPFTKDQNSGRVSVDLQKKLTSPNIVFRIRADWIGIVIPSGEPKILSVNAVKFTSGEEGKVTVQVQNVGEAAGTFSAMLVNCDPFVQSSTGITSRVTLQPDDVESIDIAVSGGTIAKQFSKDCTVKIYDVNDPSVYDTGKLSLQLEKPKICDPGKTYSEGSVIKKCNSDGTALEVLDVCTYGVTTDGSGNWVCSKPIENQTEGQVSCSLDADCPKYSSCDTSKSICFKCTDLHCCKPGKLWSDSKNACVDTSNYIGTPKDTICTAGWPNKQGKKVIINEENYACDLFEVTDPSVLSISQETSQCYDSGCNNAACHSLCSAAYLQSGADSRKDSASFKKFAGLYITYGLGPAAKYMKKYFYPELACDGTGGCPNIDEYNSNARQLQCKLSVGQPIGWASDTDMSKNSCIFSDLPTHVNINILNTGTCVDYSTTLTTLLRTVGYSKNEVYSVTAPGHEYNLVKFPGDTKWTIVDTVGNAGNPIGDTWSWGPNGSITHCDYLSDKCSNDAGQVKCPLKNEVLGC